MWQHWAEEGCVITTDQTLAFCFHLGSQFKSGTNILCDNESEGKTKIFWSKINEWGESQLWNPYAFNFKQSTHFK